MWFADGLRAAFLMFWETLWPLALGFTLAGAIEAFVPAERMTRLLGDRRPATLGLAALAGALSSSCSYAATATAKSLFQKGADFVTSMVFMLASTNLVIELGLVLWILIGWQFTLAEYVGGILMIALLALVSRFFFQPRLVEAARRHLQAPDHQHDPEGGAERSSPGTLRGWTEASAYTLGELSMVRNELVAGYLIAGFAAVLVPAAAWNAVFFHGHGLATSVENALVGPLIAILSFVCSIGNVPLAAALWNGGISFGGVISFLFADLITTPLLLIYRKYYGWALTLRILVAFWLVMAAAGLLTEGIFGAAHLVPAARGVRITEAGLAWNYTTFLNLAALALFGAQLWLARNRARFGGAGLETDPVCGMTVDPRRTGVAPVERGGETYWFCSDGCRDRFLKRDHHDHKEAAMSDSELALDPVCGMTIPKATAAATREHEGKTFYFCMEGCAQAFQADPERYLNKV